MKTIYLVTRNSYKFNEIQSLGTPFGIEIEQYYYDIRELQTLDRPVLIRHKALEAFKKIRRPVLVDHSSLEIECLNNMPGTLTQLFWDNLGGLNICKIVQAMGNNRARAVTTVGCYSYYDFYSAEGIVEGVISKKPSDDEVFQWDSIFMPKNKSQTYAEMSVDEKNAISQRKDAFEKIFREITKGIIKID